MIDFDAATTAASMDHQSYISDYLVSVQDQMCVSNGYMLLVPFFYYLLIDPDFGLPRPHLLWVYCKNHQTGFDVEHDHLLALAALVLVSSITVLVGSYLLI